MGIPHPTVAQMQAEGITNIQELADFDKESLQQLAENLRRPGGRVPDPNPNTELREWRKKRNFKPTDKSDRKGKKKSYNKKQLASLVTKRVRLAMDKSSEEPKTQDDTKAYIMSLIQEVVAPGTIPRPLLLIQWTHTRLYLKLHSEEG
jgi:hypothetical protein